MINEDSLYKLGPCTLGGIEGQGWGNYTNSGMTQNLVGSVFFEPDQYVEVEAMFNGPYPIHYEGPVYDNGSVSRRKASVNVNHLSEKSDDSPGQNRRPFIEGHPRVDFLGPGDPFL